MINLQEALLKQTKLEVTTNSKVILGSEKIFDNSVLFFTAENSFDISETEKANLKKYLENDGFVILDSFPFSNEETNPSRVGDGRKGEASLRQMILDAMGTSVRFSPITKNHEIYSNVNTFEDGPPIGGEYLKSIDKNYSGANESKDKLLPKSEPIVEVKGYLDGIYLGNKLVGVFSSKGYFIKWSDLKDNEPQLKMGVNMIVYGLSN